MAVLLLFSLLLFISSFLTFLFSFESGFGAGAGFERLGDDLIGDYSHVCFDSPEPILHITNLFERVVESSIQLQPLRRFLAECF